MNYRITNQITPLSPNRQKENRFHGGEVIWQLIGYVGLLALAVLGIRPTL